MRVSRYLVTSKEYVNERGREKRLTVVPSEELPETLPPSKSAIEKLKRILKRFNERYARMN